MNEFYGNQSACDLLASVIKRGEPSHAYLIHGADGLGKRSFAKRLATALFCQGVDKPCGVCPACIKMAHGTHVDFEEITESGKSGSISVDSIRALRLDCAIKPNEAAYKVYLIPNVERMTEGAFNAFLKTLEEPPSHVVFLLTTAATELLAPTVLSRVVSIPLFPLPVAEVQARLEQSFASADATVLKQAANMSEGNLGKAKEMVTDPDFEKVRAQADAFCRAIAQKQEYALLRALVPYEKDKQALQTVLGHVMWHLRMALRHRVDENSVTEPVESMLAQRVSAQKLMALLEYLEQVRLRVSSNANYNLSLFALAAGVGDLIA